MIGMRAANNPAIADKIGTSASAIVDTSPTIGGIRALMIAMKGGIRVCTSWIMIPTIGNTA